MASMAYGFEGMEINNQLILSFLEDSFIEIHNDEDEEQLNRVIRSLEAEINPNSIQLESCPSTKSIDIVNVEGSQHGRQDSGYGISESQDLSFEWIDFDAMPSSPSDDMNWYVDGVYEFGGFDGYSHTSYGIALEEQQFFDPLWQESNDIVMYN